MDKARMQEIAIKLSQVNKISLLSLYEFLDVPNPGKHVERVLKEQIDPVTTIEDIRNDDQDANAVEDYDMIKIGETAPPRDDVDARHIKTHNEQLASNDFKTWPVDRQEMLRQHIREEVEKAKVLNGITEEDINPPVEEPNVGIEASVSVPPAMQPQPIAPTPLPPEVPTPPVPTAQPTQLSPIA
jgi:hypothetical protein